MGSNNPLRYSVRDLSDRSAQIHGSNAGACVADMQLGKTIGTFEINGYPAVLAIILDRILGQIEE